MTAITWTDLKAIIVDPIGPVLGDEERALYVREKPAGFILFQRNCVDRAQITALVKDLRETVGFDVPVLIDQEGGSVARLRQPNFREYAAAQSFADLYVQNPQAALRAAEISSTLMARDLASMGITVNCAPVVDVPAPDCHQFLSGSRTYGRDADSVTALGGAVCRGLLAGGVTPILKHIPGHGRAKVDSHLGLPIVDTPRNELENTDFVPFRRLAASDLQSALWAMGAHVVYSDIDPDSAATVSPVVTDAIVRGHMGFDGVLIADDVSMKALAGTLADKVRQTIAAGMDVTMLCNSTLEDKAAALAACPRVAPRAALRLQAAEMARRTRVNAGDGQMAADDALLAELSQLMDKKAA